MLVPDHLTCRPPVLKDKLCSRLLFWPHYTRRRMLPALSPAQAEVVNTLREEGCAILPDYLPPATLKGLQDELENALQTLNFSMPALSQTRIKPEQHRDLIDNFMYGTPEQLESWGVTFSRHEAHSYTQVLRDFNPSTLTAQMLALSETYRQVWLDPFILGVVSHYLGMVPCLAEAYVRRNFPAPHRTMNHYWHRDLNSMHLVKMFVFISDCEIDNGPHEFLRKTHRQADVLNGKRYFSDAEVDALYPEGSTDRAVSIVKAGTVVLEDTHGLHRASLPSAGYRDLGFAVYMPVRPFYPHQNYTFPRAGLEALTAFQRAFVPAAMLTD
jgi:hypothetical protein